MCGITGIIGSKVCRRADEEALNRMTSVMAHRGPDDEGLYVDDDVRLGFRRLSIIDLNTGNQPIYNEDNSCVIVFNGEIYNYIELKKELIKREHVFYTNTDTETILHLYEEYGERCVDFLNGMFAFCIWDKTRNRAFLARDRLGKKPLYYCVLKDGFVFGSEIKCLLESGLLEASISYETLNNYMTYRFCPAPKTPFEGVHKLLPAHTLTYENGILNARRYWQVKDFNKIRGTEVSLREALLEKLRCAVRRRLVSDVPLGLFLSGGVDSSAILALMTESMEEPVKTFSIGFDFGEDFQEFQYANRVAELFGTKHTTMLIDSEDFVREIPHMVWYLEDLVADSATIPLYLVSKLAKKEITVALSGEGSDELFAGYSRLFLYDYKRQRLKKRLWSLPEFTRGRAAACFFKKVLPKYQGKFEFLRNPIGLDKVVSMGDYFTTDQKKSVLDDHIYARIAERDSYTIIENLLKNYDEINYLDRKLIVDLSYWLPDDLLIKADKATMANGVELRVPFLDYELVEFAFRIEDRYKINGDQGKYILKKALEGILPPEIVYRKKMGFPVPLSGWFRGELKERVYEVLLGKRSVERRIFKPEEIRKLLDCHASGKQNLSGHIWILIVFEIWCRIFIDNENYTEISLT